MIGSTEIELRQNEVEVSVPHTSRILLGVVATLFRGIVQFIRSNIVRISEKIRDIIDTVLSYGSKSTIKVENSEIKRRKFETM